MSQRSGKYRTLIAIWSFITKFVSLLGSHSVSVAVSVAGLWCKSLGYPEKQVSQLFINYQVLGYRTGMWAVCKGCWAR